MNWIKQHLNWTLFLGVCLLQIVGVPLLMVCAGGEGMWDFWVALAIGILIYTGIFDYILSEKGYKKHGENLPFVWCALWVTGWLGVIALLLVGNKQLGNGDMVNARTTTD